VFEHVRRDHQVERPGGEGQALGPPDHEAGVLEGRVPMVLNVEPDHMSSGSRQGFGQGASPRSRVEGSSPRQRNGLP